MKKHSFMLISVLALSVSLFSERMQAPKLPNAKTGLGYIFNNSANREAPSWEFITNPTELCFTYYDYMPGGYCGIPMQVQPANPGYCEGGGVYLVYHAQETTLGQRKIRFAYIDNEGEVTYSNAFITDDNLREGYAGIDIDPETGDPMVAWHSNVSGDANLEVCFSYDQYHMACTPGVWYERTEVINSDGDYVPNPGSDEFIWPYVHIGNSPNDGFRRVFINSNNATSSSGPEANPCENEVVAWADYNTEMLTEGSEFEWNHYTIPEFDDWHNEDPEWFRPYKSFAVSDDGQKTAYMGYRINDSAEQHGETEIFVLLNENYGEGEYQYFGEDYQFIVDSPVDPEYENYELFFTFVNSGHFNSIFFENDTKLMFLGAFGLSGRNPEDPTESVYWPYYIYPKIFTFDLITQEFSFCDMYIKGANPYDNIPMLPWDLDENGIPDSVNNEGNVVSVNGWPIYYPDSDQAFHDNNFKLVKNEERGWLAAVWQDGLKAKYAWDGYEGYEDWYGKPEIAISVFSTEIGSWSDPIFINANENDENYSPELWQMIPEYVYPGDLIEDIGNNHGKLHLMFLDDYGFGASIQGPPPSGGRIIYTSIDIDFDYPVSIGNYELQVMNYELQNYPNPFNPSTTISFQFSNEQNQHLNSFERNNDSDEQIQLEIYNLKGQRVKQFSSKSHPELVEGSIVWNAEDEAGMAVSSGIYFYKLSVDNKYSETKKMILLK
jgi:hypothetical protein